MEPIPEQEVDNDRPASSAEPSQFTVRLLLGLALAVSLVLAAWRTTGSIIVLLAGLQCLLGWIYYLDLYVVARDDFNCVTGCGAILAVMLMPLLFGATLILLFLWCIEGAWF